ncbi:hypothetical protein [Clostridium uliginosum]|uniref:Uncharacterized protein n=1 Tax=Clostridium uliginosum TaxID=119641 RepID=A0A1I1KLD7_9CLOT|nr:hypothetical protein [Clostridium uliginosum]SFC58230.1 hypothetical protein SAMN05421842_105146 [Clostridium uliginosum]
MGNMTLFITIAFAAIGGYCAGLAIKKIRSNKKNSSYINNKKINKK